MRSSKISAAFWLRQIVGWFIDTSRNYHGFVDNSGSFTNDRFSRLQVYPGPWDQRQRPDCAAVPANYSWANDIPHELGGRNSSYAPANFCAAIFRKGWGLWTVRPHQSNSRRSTPTFSRRIWSRSAARSVFRWRSTRAWAFVTGTFTALTAASAPRPRPRPRRSGGFR